MKSLNLSQIERIAREMLAADFDAEDFPSYENTPELDIPEPAQEAAPIDLVAPKSAPQAGPESGHDDISTLFDMVQELAQINHKQDRSIQIIDQIVNQDNMEVENMKQRFDGVMYNIDDIYNTLDTYSEQMGKSMDKTLENKAPADFKEPPAQAEAPIPEKPSAPEVAPPTAPVVEPEPAPATAEPAPAPEAKPDFKLEPTPAQTAPVAPKTNAPKSAPKSAPKVAPKTMAPKVEKPIEPVVEPKPATPEAKPVAPKTAPVKPLEKQFEQAFEKSKGQEDTGPTPDDEAFIDEGLDTGEEVAPAPEAKPVAPKIAPKNLKNEGLAPDTSKYVNPELQSNIQEAFGELYQGKGLKPHDIMQSLGKGANPKEVLYSMNDMVSKGQLAKDSKGNYVPAGDPTAVEAPAATVAPQAASQDENAPPKKRPGRPPISEEEKAKRLEQKNLGKKPAEQAAPETTEPEAEAKPAIEPEKLGPSIQQAVRDLFQGKGLTTKQIQDELSKTYSVDPKDIGRQLRDMRAEGLVDTDRQGLIIPKNKSMMPKSEEQPPELTNALVDFVKENPGKEISEVYKMLQNNPQFAEIMGNQGEGSKASIPQAIADLTNSGKLKRDNKGRLTVQAFAKDFVQKLEKTGKIVVINDRVYPF